MLEETSTPEEWRPAVGFPNYEVSNLGNVRRIIPAELKLTPNGDGYMLVSLPGPTGLFKKFRVHRLVAEAFIGPAPAGTDRVNHKNLTRHDNRVENLEWTDHMGNIQHAMDMGAFKNRRNRRWGGVPPPRLVGEQKVEAKLTDKDVLEIRAQRGITAASLLAARFGVSRSLISAIWRRRIWAHLPDDTGGRAVHERVSGWAKHPGGCANCGTSERPHAALGLCKRCYHAAKNRRRRAAKRSAR